MSATFALLIMTAHRCALNVTAGNKAAKTSAKAIVRNVRLPGTKTVASNLVVNATKVSPPDRRCVRTVAALSHSSLIGKISAAMNHSAVLLRNVRILTDLVVRGRNSLPSANSSSAVGHNSDRRDVHRCLKYDANLIIHP